MKTTKEKKNIYLNVRVDEKIAKFIDEQSKKKGIDRSKVVRELLHDAAIQNSNFS